MGDYMQTLNLLENRNYEYNAFKIFDTGSGDNINRKFALMEQLQCTLDLDKLLNIFAIEAAKYVSFSGLYFTNGVIKSTTRGSRKADSQRHFELKINNKLIGLLTYSINSPISLTNYKILEDSFSLTFKIE